MFASKRYFSIEHMIYRFFIPYVIFITLGLWFCVPSCEAAQTQFSVRLPAGNEVNLPVYSIGKNNYVQLADFATRIFPGGSYDAYHHEIQFKNEKLRFAPTSFFVSRHNIHEEYVAQMPLPAITIRNIVYVPMPHVFTILETLHLFTVDVMAQNIILRHTAAANPQPTGEIKENKPIAVAGKLQEESVHSSLQDHNDHKRGVYKLPSDLAMPSKERLLFAESQTPQTRQATMPPPLITSVTFTRSDNSLHCIIQADKTIPSFQKPELVQGTQLKFRIPAAAFGFKPSNIALPKEIEAIQTDIIRDIAVITFVLKKPVTDVQAARAGNATLNITIPIFTASEARNSTDTKSVHIILDPGHGGDDVGAIGVSGVYEKDITLAIAKKAKKIIEETIPDAIVHLTREKDVFIGLKQRTDFANKQQGTLFISIHCNAAPSKPHPANGFEVYVLRPGKSKDAIRVAERENASLALEKNKDIPKKLTEEQLIVATMAQSAFVKLSDKYAALLRKKIQKKSALADRGIAQAGFYVLVGASMPNILLETAFITNDDDEKYIVSEKGQREMAEAIAESVKDYISTLKENK